MDPNHLWMTQMYGLHGLNIMEQAALSSGLSPQLPHYSVPSSQNLQEQSAYKGTTITSPSPQSSTLANTLSSRLPPVSSLNQKPDNRSVFPTEYHQSSSGLPPALLHNDNNKWSSLSSFVSDLKPGLGEPPPAHSGSSKTSSQPLHRPRVPDFQSEQAALVEQLLHKQQQVLQQADPPKAHQSLLPSKYETYSDKYQVLDKYPTVQGYSDTAAKYQESASHKYKELAAQKYEDSQSLSQKYASTLSQKYQQQESIQKYKYQDPMQRYKSGGDKYQSEYEPGERYQEDRTSSRTSQLHKILNPSSRYMEPSPPSHDSSPHMGHSSPQLQPHSSPQMTHHIQHQPTYSTTYSGTVNSSSAYIMSSTPSIYTGSGENIMYEAISPVAATSTPSTNLNYNTVNLESLAQLSSGQQKLPVHQQQQQQQTNHAIQQQQQQQMQIPSPTVGAYDQQQSPMSVASPTSTVQQQPHTVRAQADSTTKSKRGRGRGGGRGGRVGGGGKGAPRKKKDDHMDDNPGLSLHMQQLQGHQQMLSPQTVNQSMTQSLENSMSLGSPIMTCPPGHNMAMQHGMVEGMAHGYEVSGINDEAMLQIQMAQGLLGMGETPSLRAEQEAILMMNNDHGNSFLNPAEQMNCLQDIKHEGNDMKSENTIEDNVGLGLSTVEHKPFRTKAAQKQKPQQDEEFAHLAPNSESPHVNTPQHVPEVKSPPPQPPKPVTKPNDGSFQSSFLSFLQGNKQETLSSVTNSSITNKPELPKYIPEPPRPKPKPKPISPPEKSDKRSSEMKLIKPESVTFSDDEESSQGSSSVQINKTVQGVISNLSDDSTGNKLSSLGGINKKLKAASDVKAAGNVRAQKPVMTLPPTEQQRKPLTLKIKMSDIKMPTDNAKSRSPSKKMKSPGLGKAKSKRKSSVDTEHCEVISDEDIPVTIGKVTATSPAQREPSPVIPRQRSSRKAKEIVEEKRKARHEKKSKKKKKKKLKYESADSDMSSEDLYLDDTDEDKDYDSDKDPVWIPGEKGVVGPEEDPEKQSHLANLMKSKPRGSSSSKSATSRRRKTQSDNDDEYEEPLVPPVKRSRSQSTRQPDNEDKPNPTAKKNVIIEECDSDDNSPHQYTKGDFVMEKKELCNPDKYVIWKIDAGKLIQKFEPFMLDGKLVHKSLSTYSSWSDYFKPNYMGIQVRTMSSIKNQEVVEVLEPYRPKPADEVLEKDDSMENFNVYVQILVSQTLEPGFLSLVKQQDEDYYTAPLDKMERLLQEKKKQLAEIIEWTSQFKEIVDKYPLLRIAEKYSVDQNLHCQASVAGSEEVAVKTARLYGDPYNYETLDKLTTGQLTVDKAIEFHLGDLAGKYLRQYHRLHHFKFRMYKKCLYMVDCLRRAGGKDTSEVLDQCLQSRVWVQSLFRELKKLLEIEDSRHTTASAEDQNSTTTITTTTTNDTESAQPSTQSLEAMTQGLSTQPSNQPSSSNVTLSQDSTVVAPSNGEDGVYNDTSLTVQEPSFL